MFSVTPDSHTSSKQKHHEWDLHSCTIWALGRDIKRCRCPGQGQISSVQVMEETALQYSPRPLAQPSEVARLGMRPYNMVLQTSEVALSHLVLWTGLRSHLELIQGKEVERYCSTLLTDPGQALSPTFLLGCFGFFPPKLCREISLCPIGRSNHFPSSGNHI